MSLHIESKLQAQSLGKIEFGELPDWCPRAVKLLSPQPITAHRTRRQDVQHEYENDTYAPLLRHFHESLGTSSFDDIRQFQMQRGLSNRSLVAHPAGSNFPASAACVSLQDELWIVDRTLAAECAYQVAIDYVMTHIGHCRTVLDLGSGYGYLLHRLMSQISDRDWAGADFSAHAVELGRCLFRETPSVHLHWFDFYEPDSFGFVERLEAPVFVTTRHALEQLPSAKTLIDSLAGYRDRIGIVAHFEPVHRSADASPLGVLRNRYMESQNYNRDLLEILQQRGDIELLDDQPNVIGVNPLNPTSILRWRFRP